MTLGALLKMLKLLPVNTLMPNAPREPHCHRSSPRDLALKVPTEPQWCSNATATVGGVIEMLENVMKMEYVGYKGGNFKFTQDTDVYLVAHIHQTGEELRGLLFTEEGVTLERKASDCPLQ